MKPCLLINFIALSWAALVLAAPTLTTTEPAPSATVPALTTIKVTFSEPVIGIDPDDLIINAASAAAVDGSGEGPYEFTFTQPLPGDVSISWDADHGIASVAGEGGYVPESGWTYQLMDTLPPQIGVVREGKDLESIVPIPGAKVNRLTQTEVRFSEVVTGVLAKHLLVGGAVASSVTGEGAGPYIFTFSEPVAGNVNFEWAAGQTIADLAGNAFEGDSWSVNLAPGERGALEITEFMASNATILTDNDDDSPDWIEIYNPGEASVNLLGWTLSPDPEQPDLWVAPSKSIGPGERLVLFASGKDTDSIFGKTHTNFTLDLSGGYLALHSPESPREVVSVYDDYPEQRVDFSYGLNADNAAVYFNEPTPQNENTGSGMTQVTPQPSVNVSRGFFAEPFEVIVSSQDPGATIRYTLNGSEPTTFSPAYTQPLPIDQTTVLRVAASASGKVSSNTVTHSYIFLDQILDQPSPPYDNPDREDDNDNPPLPTVGGATFPITWGTQSGAGFPGEISNLPSNAAPADYGMDPEINDDPNKYNDDGEVDPSGITNRERMNRAFRELPLMSVVMPNNDMFGSRGLHPNSRQKGTQFEFACSVELLLPDGTTGFDTTCGIRMHGNASREPRKCPKHGFKLNFKSSFGAAKLTHALFPDSPSREFDDIILRGDFNSSWLHWDGGQQRPRATRMRDAFSKDTFRDMGRAAGHHRYVHLFINGLYWGLYDPTEQENHGFAANTFGGDSEDYDVVEQGGLKSGSKDAYDEMLDISRPIDNEKYGEMKELLDVEWYADYMLLHFFLGHQDWGENINKNWYAVRHKEGQFRFLPWDMENLMWDEDVDRTGASAPPGGLHTKLVSNDQYLLDFADRAHKHLVAPDGALRPENNIARWNKWRAVVQDAIVCEAARWGDYRRDVHQHQSGPYPLFTWTDHWMVEQRRLTETWFPDRPDIVLRQLRDRGLYPSVRAPQFKDSERTIIGSQRVSAGFEIQISKASVFAGGTLYYTTDGSDPRVYLDSTGELTPTAQQYTSPIVINETTVVKARALDRGNWSALMEATFSVGSTSADMRITEVHYNAKGALGGSAAEFIELQNVSDTPIDLGKWSFQGIEFVFPWGTVVRPGARIVVASNDAPNIFHAQHPGVQVAGYYGGRLDNNGERIALLDGRGQLVTAVEYDDNTPWPVEADNDGPSIAIIDPRGDPQSPYNWRASEGANGSPGLANNVPDSSHVIISEFLAKSSTEAGFVELLNMGDLAVDLSGWQLMPSNAEDAVSIANGTMLVPNTYLSIEVNLSDEWDLVSLLDQGSMVVDGVRYGPQAADVSFNRAGPDWQPGQPSKDAGAVAASSGSLTDLRLNEWLADPSPGFDDWLELTNTNADTPVVLAGLRVQVNNESFLVTAPAVIEPGGTLRLVCDRGARRADAVWLQLPAKGATLSLATFEGDVFESVTYDTQTQGISVGRVPDATGDIVALDYPSPGLPNAVAEDGMVQLNEVLIGTNPWIELVAKGAIDLEGWQLRTVSHSPVDWVFPVLSLSAGDHHVEESRLPVDNTYEHWGVELLNPVGQVVDRITWGLQISNQSIGRLTDGSWALLESSSRGAVNGDAAVLGEITALRINEWFAADGDTVLDDSFLELHNPGNVPIALGGLWLSDEPSEAGRRKWQIPKLSYIAPGGYAAFTSGGGTSNPSRFRFDIARGGEFLQLAAGDDAGTVIDGIGFGIQLSDTHARGRFPDGGGVVSEILTPTPGDANTDQASEGRSYDAWAVENGITDPNADNDGDGLRNFIEFLANLDPNVPAIASEREQTDENIQIRVVDGRTYISFELRIEKSSTYSDLLGEWSPDLRAPWSAAQPDTMEVLSEEPPGTEQIRLQFAVPENSPAHFLRIRLVP